MGMTCEQRVFLRDLFRFSTFLMRCGVSAMTLSALTLSAQTKGAAEKENSPTLKAETFDTASVGSLPTGWVTAQTGAGRPQWAVVVDPSAPSPGNVLKQSGVADYPLCVLTNAAIQDGFVEVRFKPLSGVKDQAGGLVWRYRDANTYYICRANALENNVVLYKVENGKRTPLDIVGRTAGYGVNAPVPGQQWSRLRVEFAGSRHKVFFNGALLFEVEDRTFTQAGAVGLWTKADSMTVFDDFAYRGSPIATATKQ
jgi:hypothetical protein